MRFFRGRADEPTAHPRAEFAGTPSALANAHARRTQRADGVETMRPSELSGGMRKRVGLARTLALEPEVILYDEPNTGLDPVNAARIDQLIRIIQKTLDVTSVVVTHDMRTAFTVGDRLVMLDRGRVRRVGTPSDFRSTTDEIVRAFVDGRVTQPEQRAQR
ncbi:MAG TPA: ATP-binding cassette domain-containing protein [Polyangiaceae bacterium]